MVKESVCIRICLTHTTSTSCVAEDDTRFIGCLYVRLRPQEQLASVVLALHGGYVQSRPTSEKIGWGAAWKEIHWDPTTNNGTQWDPIGCRACNEMKYLLTE